ncbi:hypothetical protein BHM03_00014661 [Ensete ventricosum]|nr:hypothetical protein BHM03_00014661 [Ensete ventricosum]
MRGGLQAIVSTQGAREGNVDGLVASEQSSKITPLWKLQQKLSDHCGELQWEDVDGADGMQTLPSGGDVAVAGRAGRAKDVLEGDHATN